ncbi:tetratricopeptide repeat protein [Emticicia oligotrophica]|uniref:tetratricopeptide repeat protein n=1 Tax=Emticicia oligotrophica TaxID=312279 RepID=UPI00273BBC94|nr:tetratricopeptide repeat protein [Emticicia oligotrophica]
MKKAISIFSLALVSLFSFGQNKEAADKLCDEGIIYHDKGDYEGAIARYDQALELDKDNLYALGEKAFSLLSLQKHDEAIRICEKAISINPTDPIIKSVYVTYGNALDALKKTDQSIAVYDKGLVHFPEFYQLYFNKGVTLVSVKKYDDAMANFQNAVLCNPGHGSSHNAIARLSAMKEKDMHAILAFSRFLVVEPQSTRSQENIKFLLETMKFNVEQTGKKSVTINISESLFSDTTATGAPTEDSFATTELILMTEAALDYDKKLKKQTEVEKFLRKINTMCDSMKEVQAKNHGFFWEYYAPYFIEMKNKNHTETFAYIAFASTEDKDAAKWLESHDTEITAFYDWSKSFSWKKR